MSESFKEKEKDYTAKLSRLRMELQTLERERETWKQASKSATADSQANQAAPAAVPTSTATLLQIDALKAEITALQSTVRYLRTIHQQSFLAASNKFLSAPITPRPPSRNPHVTEIKDALKQMVQLVAQPNSQPIRLQRRVQEDRLRWRPLKETSAWHVQRQREEFEEWREWRDSLTRRLGRERKAEKRPKQAARDGAAPADRPRSKAMANGPVRVVGETEDS